MVCGTIGAVTVRASGPEPEISEDEYCGACAAIPCDGPEALSEGLGELEATDVGTLVTVPGVDDGVCETALALPCACELNAAAESCTDVAGTFCWLTVPAGPAAVWPPDGGVEPRRIKVSCPCDC